MSQHGLDGRTKPRTPAQIAHTAQMPRHGRKPGTLNKLTRADVERELRFLATSNILDAFSGVHGNTKRFTLRELRDMPESFQRCISSIKVRTENLTAGDGAQDTTVEIKLWDKTKALELCARSLGMLKDHVVIEGLGERKMRLRVALARITPAELTAAGVGASPLVLDAAPVTEGSHE